MSCDAQYIIFSMLVMILPDDKLRFPNKHSDILSQCKPHVCFLAFASQQFSCSVLSFLRLIQITGCHRISNDTKGKRLYILISSSCSAVNCKGRGI